MKIKEIKKIALSSMFLCIGLVLPLLTGQLKEIGDSILPMHIPVMLCGLICGARFGLIVGFLLPFMRSVIFGMPPIYPNAVWMALELAAYGFVIGIMYTHMKDKNIKCVYISLLSAMLVGRVVWGISKAVLLGLSGKYFGLAAFISGGFIDSFPGISLQLVLIPLIMNIINRKRAIV